MTQEERDWSIYQIEEFYCKRMEYLVDKEQFDDSHSIFEEFVINVKNLKNMSLWSITKKFK